MPSTHNIAATCIMLMAHTRVHPLVIRMLLAARQHIPVQQVPIWVLLQLTQMLMEVQRLTPVQMVPSEVLLQLIRTPMEAPLRPSGIGKIIKLSQQQIIVKVIQSYLFTLKIKKMKILKIIFGVLLIITGLMCLPKVFTPDVYETIGGIIGVTLVTFLPAYFLLRNKKKEEKNENQSITK